MVKQEIEDSKIRIAIWELKTGKTKKQACKTLGIAYNTKRLNKIIDDFKNKQQRIKILKEKAKKTPLTDSQKKVIISSYINGEAQSVIAEQNYISAIRVKKVLLENNIPIRSRSKKKPANVEHVVQDLDIKFSKNDKVFIPSKSGYGFIKEVYDENYIEDLQDGYSKAVDLKIPVKNKEVLGIHYEEYWVHKGIVTNWKTHALQKMLSNLETLIAETGRETYKVWFVGSDKSKVEGGFYTFNRKDLYPVIIV